MALNHRLEPGHIRNSMLPCSRSIRPVSHPFLRFQPALVKNAGNVPKFGDNCLDGIALDLGRRAEKISGRRLLENFVVSLIQQKTAKITGCFMTTAFFNSLLFDCIRPPASVKGLRFAPMNDSFLPPKAGTILNDWQRPKVRE